MLDLTDIIGFGGRFTAHVSCRRVYRLNVNASQ
jgi:hypothetical protein